jgi:hypothetical protein
MIALGITGAPAATIALNNGSFEAPDLPDWTLGVPISGWDSSGDNTKFGYGPVANDGTQGLFFEFGGGWRGVSQNTSYTVGQAGEVLDFSTWVNIGNYDGDPNVVWFNEAITIDLAIANQVQPAFTTSVGWTQVSVSYTTVAADIGKTVGVRFGFQSDGWAQTFADQTLLTVIPEPSAALISGLGMLALLRRRR